MRRKAYATFGIEELHQFKYLSDQKSHNGDVSFSQEPRADGKREWIHEVRSVIGEFAITVDRRWSSPTQQKMN